MSSNFNNAKVINVYYNKGDRKPYDVNGKPIAYIGEEAIGATEATTIRFYLGEDLDSSTAVIVTKRPDGERRLDLCEKFGTGVNSYYQVTLNAWYGAVKGKATLAFKVYNGEVEFDDEETPTEIISVNGRIVVSDIFNLEIAYAPEADLIVPADDTPDYVEWFAALSTKLDKAQSITVTGALPTLTGDVYDDRYFYVENEGVGRLYYINGSTAIEVVWQVGTLKLTSNGNEDINVGTNAGKMYWDEDRGTIIAGLYDDQETGVGDSLFFFGKATEAIAKGEVIQFNGNAGGNIRIKKAVFSEISAQPDLLMGVAKHNIANGDFGYVVSFGYVRNLNTSAFSTNILYLSTSVAGALSSTKPTTGFKGSIAAIARPSNDGNNGFIIVRPNLVKGVGDLADVTITTATSGQILSFDGSKWVNSTRLSTAESNITNLQGRMTAEEANVDNLQGRMTSAEGDIDDIESGATVVPRALGDQNGNTINTTYLTQSSASATYIPLSQKAQANGVATLGADGRVIPSQIPGIVSSVEEYDSLEDFPEVGVLTTVYLALDTGLTYLWSGSNYVALSSSLALGETSTTAYRGDRGKIAYDYSQVGHLPLAGGTITNNLTVGGDLTVSGTTTTVNTQEINIKDNLILINSNQTGEPNDSLKGGLEIERGDLTNFQFVFDESDDRFKVGQVGSLQTVATRTDDGTIANRGITFFNTSTNRLENNANIVIDSDNRVGIGTTTTAININSGATVLSKVAIRNDSASTTRDSEPPTLNLINNSSVTQNQMSRLAFSARSGLAEPIISADITAIYVGDSSGNGRSSDLVFGTSLQTVSQSPIERMRITSGGNVGIGTSSPARILEISSATNAQSYLRISGASGNAADTNFAGIEFFNNDGSQAGPNVASFIEARAIDTTGAGGHLVFGTSIAEASEGARATEKMRILGNGNVGIGTTSPSQLLHLAKSSADDVFTRYQNSNNAQFIVGLQNSGDILIFNTANTSMRFGTNDAERMRIANNGNVGIGTASPGSKLSVFGSTSSPALSVNPNSTTNSSIECLVSSNNTTQAAFYVYSFGNNDFNAIIYSNGNIVNRNNSYGSISDIRLKENITDAKPKLNDLNKVRIVNFNFKNEETKQLGVIAQELQEIFPGMVEETEDKDKEGNSLGTTTKSVKYSVFVPMLIKAVQELKEQLDELKAKVG
jgi:hypothetical protein